MGRKVSGLCPIQSQMADYAMKSFKEVDTMKENRNIQIIIRPVEDREGEHIAYYTNEFLKATFSVHIKDNIFGALALHSFAEMIRKTYGKNYRSGEIDFKVSSEAMSFENKALLDVLSFKYAACA